jgi:hypothetical protein
MNPVFLSYWTGFNTTKRLKLFRCQPLEAPLHRRITAGQTMLFTGMPADDDCLNPGLAPFAGNIGKGLNGAGQVSMVWSSDRLWLRIPDLRAGIDSDPTAISLRPGCDTY